MFSLFFCLPILMLLNINVGYEVDIEAGQTIDLLKNYGLLLGIFPSNSNHEEFISDQFMPSIFEEKNSENKSIFLQTPVNNTDAHLWKVKNCENILSVLDEIFADYKIDLVIRTRVAFSNSWATKLLGEFIGLNSLVFSETNRFLVVKYSKKNTIVQVNSKDLPLKSTFLEAVEQIVVGDKLSVLKFISEFGSHFMSSYSMGSVIYQVFSFPSKYYDCLSKYCADSCRFDDLSWGNCTHEVPVKKGRIKTFSDNKLNNFTPNQGMHSATISFGFDIKKSGIIHSYAGISKDDKEVISSFHLVSISDLIKHKEKSLFVREVIDNQIALRDLLL